MGLKVQLQSLVISPELNRTGFAGGWFF